jgi:hypothetical protein
LYLLSAQRFGYGRWVDEGEGEKLAGSETARGLVAEDKGLK